MSPLRMPGLAWLAITGALLLWQPAAADWHRRGEDLMGTRISAELWHPDRAAAEAALPPSHRPTIAPFLLHIENHPMLVNTSQFLTRRRSGTAPAAAAAARIRPRR